MIKVFGEARSGTTYLEKLLQKNGCGVMPNGKGHDSGWKHGFPKHTKGALHVFLMRDIYQWIRSMATGFDSRWDGLREQFDHWEHPIECRTAKYISYINFASRYGAVLLNTEHLKSNPDVITTFTDIETVDDITKHVRLGIDSKDDPNRLQLTERQIKWIDEHKNDHIESFVDNLTVL